MVETSAWERFCERASRVLREANENIITLEEAAEFFENDKTISDPEIRRYLEYIIWEIDGSPGYYADLLKLFEARVTEEELVRYVNS